MRESDHVMGAVPAGVAEPSAARGVLWRRASVVARYVLVGLVVAGVLLRILAAVSWWPAAPTLDDGYQLFAGSNPFMDPLHPPGYALILGAIGALTREIAFTVVVQHLVGITSALVLGAATRRATGSVWAALVPAGFVLLDGDQIFLEHAVMSECWQVFFTSVGLYAAVRAFDEAERGWFWPLASGVALALAVVIRSAGLLMIPVAVVAILVCGTPLRGRWRPALAAAGAAALVLVAFSAAGAAFGERFGIAPSPGWYLYSRAAQFADCTRFTPPAGTKVLCERRRPSQRPTAYFYETSPDSPAIRHFGRFGAHDGLIGGWARRAVFAQPGDFASLAWTYLRGYWVPRSLPARIRSGSTELDPQLDFTYGNVFFVGAIHRDLEGYYKPFKQHTRHWGLRVLRDWQLLVRFGATLLFVTTVLTALGLAVGDRRSRAAVLLFGVGGLVLIVAPALASTYSGRYTVPMAGPLVAASAVAVRSLWARLR